MEKGSAMGSGPVGVAVVGAGAISDQYLPNMKAYPDLDVRFVADVMADRAAQQADRYDVPASGIVAEALARDDVELIVNITIPAAHHEVARLALEAGKHVWNEKPLATALAEAQGLVKQADALGLLLGCAPDTVLGPGIQTARPHIESGDIGRLLTASLVMQTPGPHRWHPNPEFLYQAGGGPLLDMGPYYLTTLVHVFGPVARVVALGSTSGPSRVIGSGPRAGESFDVTVPSYITALYEFRSGAVAQATFSFDSALERTGVVEIAGADGTLVAPDPNMFEGLVEIIQPGSEQMTTVRRATKVQAAGAGRGIGALDMARCIRTGSAPSASGRAALHVLDALLATERSASAGGFVDVPTEFEVPAPMPEDWDPLVRTL
jgi:predicted dehydrogenase